MSALIQIWSFVYIYIYLVSIWTLVPPPFDFWLNHGVEFSFLCSTFDVLVRGKSRSPHQATGSGRDAAE